MFRSFFVKRKRLEILKNIDLSQPVINNLKIGLCSEIDQIMEGAQLLHRSYQRRNILQGLPGSARLSLYTILPSTALIVAKTGPLVVGTVQLLQRTDSNLPIEETFDLSAIDNGRIVEVGSLALHDLRAKNLADVYFPLVAYILYLCKRVIKADKLVIAVQPGTIPFYQSLFGFQIIPGTQPQKHRFAANTEAVAMWIDLHNVDTFLKDSYRKLPPKWNLEDFLTVNSNIVNLFEPPASPEPGIHPKPAIVIEEVYVNKTPLLTQAPFEWRKNIATLYPDTDEYRWLFKLDSEISNRSARRYMVDGEVILTDSFGLTRRGKLVDISTGGVRIVLAEKSAPPALEEEITVELRPKDSQPIVLKGILKRADLSDYSLGIKFVDPSIEYLDFAEEVRGTTLGNTSFTQGTNTPTHRPSSKLDSQKVPSTGSFMAKKDTMPKS